MNKDLLLITGASSDIGLALIRRLASTHQERRIVAHYNSSEKRIEELREQLGSASIYPLQSDFSSESSTVEFTEKITHDFGIPSRIVHLPGVKLLYERFTKFNWEHFQTDFNVQVRSAVIVLRKFLPAMAELPNSKIVFVLSSVTRGTPPKYLSMYSIVKQSQLGLMRSLAAEYGKTGPTVNAVSPSMVETRFLDNVPEITRQMAAAESPLGRNAQPEDVAAAIEFLLSAESSYVTGIELPVTGGATL